MNKILYTYMLHLSSYGKLPLSAFYGSLSKKERIAHPFRRMLRVMEEHGAVTIRDGVIFLKSRKKVLGRYAHSKFKFPKTYSYSEFKYIVIMVFILEDIKQQEYRKWRKEFRFRVKMRPENLKTEEEIKAWEMQRAKEKVEFLGDNPSWPAFFSTRYLAKRIGVSAMTISRYLREMVKRGMIKIKRLLYQIREELATSFYNYHYMGKRFLYLGQRIIFPDIPIPRFKENDYVYLYLTFIHQNNF